MSTSNFFRVGVAIRLSKKPEAITKRIYVYFQYVNVHIQLIVERRTQIFFLDRFNQPPRHKKKRSNPWLDLTKLYDHCNSQRSPASSKNNQRCARHEPAITSRRPSRSRRTGLP
ncbi:hypothetical protein [Pseudomonas retamae]|uniref:Uncharacterized protein n=1 Tax=Pseudomonas retamae TaxID=702110 RepID=A0ABW7DDX0_9PSED